MEEVKEEMAKNQETKN